MTVDPTPCDVCGRPATVVRPATRNRELAHYCDYCASRYLGWGDTFRRLDPPDEPPTLLVS